MSRNELLGLLKVCKGVEVVVHLTRDCSIMTKVSKAEARRMIEAGPSDEEITAMYLRNSRLLVLG
jgi:hypothetical protein